MLYQPPSVEVRYSVTVRPKDNFDIKVVCSSQQGFLSVLMLRIIFQ